MIISVLAGGLGNQLFQYAFGFRLARQCQTELRLERHLLESRLLARLRQYTPRHYELNAFTIKPTDASPYDVMRCLSRMLLPGQRAILLRDSDPDVSPCFDGQTQDVLCFGYWQSEDYFKSEAEALRQQLTFRQRPSDLTLTIADAVLSAPNATFVHVRRGDYVANPIANQHHGVCGVDYYHRSIKYLHERVSGAQFFVFSDDHDWVKQALGHLIQPATFVEHNTGVDNWQDMYLMSLCRHAIVANSSFSWWGAWLNPATDRVVVAPRQWFAADTSTYPAVVPPHWISL
ncbi:alpha-1,2-fucosyltransferase [Spirosoma arcticum]